MANRPLPRNATIAVAGGKGGCGKTTATLGLATALVQRGRRPVAVDADRDVPDLHIRAGVDREPGVPAISGGTRPAMVSQSSDRFPGVAIVAAGTERVGTRRGLVSVADLARPVLLDCPAGAGPDAAEPLRVADACVVASTATRPGRADAAKTIEMARSLGTEPVAALECRVGGDPPTRSGARSVDLPTIAVPDGGRKPLRNRSVRAAFKRVVRHLYDERRGSRAKTPGRRSDSHS